MNLKRFDSINNYMLKYILKNEKVYFLISDISSYLFENPSFIYEVEFFLNKTRKKIDFLYENENLVINGNDLHVVFSHFNPIFNYEQKEKIKQIEKELQSLGIFKTKRRNQSFKLYIMYNQSYRCANCQNLLTPYCEIDHIVPLHQNGKDDLENLQALCNNCHGKKSYLERFKDFVI